jgi:hypothetical protein
MPNFSLSRNQRIYLQNETVAGTINNTSGAATVTGSNACRFIRCSTSPSVALLKRPDKTGSRTPTAGVAGRKTAAWNVEMSLAANGVAGVVPDCDPILQALFGAAPTINAGTSVVYNLSDAIKAFTLWNYRTPSTVMQQLAFGCVVNEATFNLGQEVAIWSASGTALWARDSVDWANDPTDGKGGLTAGSMPAEPVTPVTNGNMIAGFTGVATFDGNVMANIRSSTLKVVTGNAIVTDTFGKYFGDTFEGDERGSALSFSIYDDDSAGSTNLYQKAKSKAPIDITLQIGTIAGSRWTFLIKGVQLAVPAMSDGQRRWSADFSDSMASGSSLTALDEVRLTIS